MSLSATGLILSRANYPWLIELGLPLEIQRKGARVWMACLDHPEASRLELGEFLAQEERERANRFVIEAVRRRFAASRVALRLLVGHQLQVDPGRVEFSYGPAGKPFLALEHEARLHFNLAHSDERALIALVPDREVGIDVELIQSKIEALEIAARFFAPTESRLLEEASAADRLPLFYRIWTRKEAVLKACGVGIASGLRTPDVSAGLMAAPADAIANIELEGRRWMVSDLKPDTNYLAAIVVAGDEAPTANDKNE